MNKTNNMDTLYIIVKENPDGPGTIFIEIEDEKGNSVSVPWSEDAGKNRGYQRIGPVYRPKEKQS